MSNAPGYSPETAFDGVEGIEATLLSRTETGRVPEFETVVLRLDIAPGALLPRHTHPGDEHLVLLEDGELTAPDGTRTPLRRGEHVLFPAGRAHGNVRSTGRAPLAMVAIVTKPRDAPFLQFETVGEA